MKTKFVGAFLLAVAIALIPVAASAAPGNPHQEETDGCDHGSTGKPCKDDPSENGKDCDVHGNHGGVNEDHCDTETTEGPTTTTTAPADDETTTTTKPEVIVTTTTTVVIVPKDGDDEDEDEVTTTTVPVVVVPPTSTTAPVVVRTVPVDETPVPAPAPVAEVDVPEAPHVVCVGSTGFTFKAAVCPSADVIVDGTAPVAAPTGELPRTGSGTGFVGMVGFILVLAGAGIQLIFRPLLKA